MTTKYQEHKIEDVMRWFAEGFDTDPEQPILKHDYWLDPVKGVVIFRLYLGEPFHKPTLKKPTGL